MGEGEVYHISVMLKETIDALRVENGGIFVDVTFGGGGHSREILRRMGNGGRLIAFDQDTDALKNGVDDKRLTIVNHNFRFMADYVDYITGGAKVDGILADLGVSSHHFDSAERGFSFRADGPLDMRMNREAKLTAEEVVNTYDEDKLAKILATYGEVDNARRVAQRIVRERVATVIDTTEKLREVVEKTTSRGDSNKTLTKVFQAIRIEVNHEMDALVGMLRGATQILKPGGRLVVLSYHSLEDRMVKNVIKTGDPLCSEAETDAIYGGSKSPFKQSNRKPMLPTEEEIERNPRARSAKMRCAEKAR